MNRNLGKLLEMVRDREADVLQPMGLQRLGHDWATKQEQQQRYAEVLTQGTRECDCICLHGAFVAVLKLR